MKNKIECFNSAAEMLCGELASVLSRVPETKKQSIQEIRLRSGKPVALSDGTETLFVCKDGSIVYTPERAFVCTQRHIFDTFKQLCSYSVYSRQNEIKNGYITIRGGHRIGLCGTASIKDGEINSITDITSLNVRIARQIFGAAEELMPYITPLTGGVLIAGAPSTGKTTLLRDIAYRLSQGVNCRIMRTCVIDERGELSGAYRDDSEIDLGFSDVLRSYPKGEGIMQAIRSLSPQVIICDEVGTQADAMAIAQGTNAGAYIIATIHAVSLDSLMHRKQARQLIETGAFKTLILLGSTDKPCSFSDITDLSGLEAAV